MVRLTLLLHSIAATVIMGAGIVSALVLGYVSTAAILIGLVLGWPVARLIAKELYER